MNLPKLIRDKIPQIIKKSGKTPITHIASKKEYQEKLTLKLQEEVDEYFESESVDELADILEVIYALGITKNFTPKTLESLRQKKAKQRGAYTKRIILNEVK